MHRLIVIVGLAFALGCAGTEEGLVPVEGFHVRAVQVNGTKGKPEVIHSGYDPFAVSADSEGDWGWGSDSFPGPSYGGRGRLLSDGRLSEEFRVNLDFQLSLAFGPTDPMRAIAGRTNAGKVYVLMAVPDPGEPGPETTKPDGLVINYTVFDLDTGEAPARDVETLPIREFQLDRLRPEEKVTFELIPALHPVILSDSVSPEQLHQIIERTGPDYIDDISCTLTVTGINQGLIEVTVSATLDKHKQKVTGVLPIRDGEVRTFLLPEEGQPRLLWIFAISPAKKR